jgi:DnaJ homolog subfamily A member 2
VYDRYGEAGLQEGGAGGMHTAEDIFAQFFGGGGGFFGGGGGGRARGPRRGKDVEHTLPVRLEDLYNGKTTKLSLRKTVLCSGCGGKGGKNVRTCNGCGGSGRKTMLRQTGIMLQQIESACGECDGQGEIMAAKDRCTICRGSKVCEEKKVLEVHIERGMSDGTEIRFQGEGDQGPQIQVPGDVVIRVTQQPHSVYKRSGSDLAATIEVDLLTALAGGTLYVPTLDSRTLKIAVTDTILTPGMERMVKGEGMPIHKRPFDRGNLYVTFTIKFPQQLPPSVLPHLEAALPPRPTPSPSLIHPDALEDVSLVLPLPKKKEAHSHSHEEQEDAHGHPGVQCAQQ